MVVPLLIVALSMFFATAVGQFAADPDYIYLLNGLNITGLHQTELMSHPGTPLQMFSAAVIVVVWLTRTALQLALSLDEDVLSHSELYLFCIKAVVAIFGGAGVFFLGWRLLQATGRVVAAGAAQLPFLMSIPVVTAALPHVSAEAFLVGLTALLAGVQVRLVFAKPGESDERRLAMPVGLLLGACVATKMTALPLCLTVFFFRSHRTRAMAASWFTLAAIVLTLPIAHRYGDVVRLLIRTVIRSESLGAGNVGVSSFATLWENSKAAWYWAPELILCVAACFALVLSGAGKEQSGEVDFKRLFLVAALPVAILLALVIMHPPQYYLVAMVATAGLAFAGMVCLLARAPGWMRWCGAIAGVVLAGFGLAHGQGAAASTLAAWRTESQANRAFFAKYADPSDGCALVYYNDPREVIEWKLLLGIRFAGFRHIPAFARLYPTFRAYDPETQRIYRSNLEFSPAAAATFAGETCVYFLGYVFDSMPVGFLTLRARASDHRYSLAVYEYRP